MRTSFSALLALSNVASAATTSGCSFGSNCARAVQSASLKASRSADCSSYQTTFVRSTVTAGTTTVFLGGGPVYTEPPLPSQTGTPTYASVCTKEAAYRSACSCVGTTSTIITAPTYTVPATTKTCTTFAVQATDGPFAGDYLYKSPMAGNKDTYINQTDIQQALKFVFNSSQLYQPGSNSIGLESDIDQNPAPIILSDIVQDEHGTANFPVQCTVGAKYGLSCVVKYFPGRNLLAYSPNRDGRALIDGASDLGGDVVFTPKVVCVD